MPQKPVSIESVHAEIDAWFAEQIQRPPLSHDVHVYNQAHAAHANLHQRLHRLITGTAMPAPAAEPEITEATAEAPASTKE